MDVISKTSSRVSCMSLKRSACAMDPARRGQQRSEEEKHARSERGYGPLVARAWLKVKVSVSLAPRVATQGSGPWAGGAAAASQCDTRCWHAGPRVACHRPGAGGDSRRGVARPATTQPCSGQRRPRKAPECGGGRGPPGKAKSQSCAVFVGAKQLVACHGWPLPILPRRHVRARWGDTDSGDLRI